MESLLLLAAALAAGACPAIYGKAYRHFTTPIFFYLFMASALLAGAAAAVCFKSWPPAGAIADVCVALSGMAMAAASWQSRCAFGLAGDAND